ncbi:RICIN domain-containing protein [Kitasatospora sp. NBC_01266]|uniref:RICIN domain-containing protein n=1 Tax=Kitasatospora sp. NBC_01266 TaxID=2903572 RepID=UPI002E306B4B|nr:RICIN domain-containing protein [Kitasatospora sp. NBC_01266]
MNFRTPRRARAALASLVPLALAVTCVAPVTSAGATTPSYTITTGTTGSYAYADDTPAYPFIDSNGQFYFQSSHSLYAGSDSRAWNFYTGTDIDTNVSKAAISSAPDNADTTVRCNTSPTGQMSTYDPRGSQTSGYAEKNYCDLIGVWVDPDTGTWYGAVHDEFTPSPFGDGLHYDSIDYAQSTDHGSTWTITDHMITSPFTTWRENDQLFTPATDGSVHTNGGQCLDITGGGTTAGTAVGKYGCTGNANQKWTVSNGTLVNPASGLCLTASGTGAGSTFTLQTCSGATTQTLTTPAAGAKGQIKLTGTPTSCIDSTSTLQLAACNDPSKDGKAQFPNQTYYYGDGDPKLFVDYASGYFYLYYDTQILNQAGGGRVDLGHVARAPISGKMAPSSWTKWYNGSWTQPGQGGKEADLIASDGTTSGYINDAYNPANTGTTAQQLTAGQLPSAAPLAWLDVAYDAYLGMYISTARPENPVTATPLHFYGTTDLSTQKWVDLGTTSSPSGAAWYRSLLDGTSRTANQLVGKSFRNYCMYSCGTLSSAGYVNTTIDTAAANLPVPPVTTGSAYQIAAGSGQYLAQSGSTLTTAAGSSTSASQAWTFTATGDGFFTIANAASGQNIGVNDTANSGRAWGAPLTLSTGTSVGYQWFVQAVNDANLPSGSYRLVNRYSGQALSLTTGTGGAATAPQRDWANTGTSGDTHAVNAQTLTFPAGSANANLIPGGNFESGNLTGWTVHNATIVTDAAAHSPSHDLQLAAPAGDYATMEYTVTGLTPNTTYTYSGWVRADSGASTSVGVKNFGGTQVTTHSTATGWTPVSNTFTTGPTNSTATVFCYLPAGAATATSTCDDLSLTTG